MRPLAVRPLAVRPLAVRPLAVRPLAVVLAAVLLQGFLGLAGPMPEARAQVGEASEGAYAVQAEGDVQVGFGKAGIQPREPTALSYGAQEPTTAAYDSVNVHAVLLEVGEVRVALLEYDVIGIGRRVAERIRKTVAEQTGLDPRHLIVAATHSHSYARVYKDRVTRLMVRQGVEAATAALESRFPARVGIGETQACEDLNLNRAELEGTANAQLHVLRAEDRQGNLRGLMYNYGTHPTIFTEWGRNQSWFGPDWPGYVSEYVQARKRLDLLYERYAHKRDVDATPFVMFAQGAGGDQQPRRSDVTTAGGEERPPKQVFMEDLAEEVLEGLATATPTRARLQMALRSKTVSLRTRDGGTRDVLVQTLTLGDAAFVTIPGELGVALAERLRAASPFEKNVVITNANDYIGYIVPERLARERVTYQAKGVRFGPHYGAQIVDAALTLLDPGYEPPAPLGPSVASGSISGTVEYDGPNGVAVGVKRIPAPPNYAGGFWGRRTVAGPGGRWTIDSLAAGTFYLYAAEVDPQNPSPAHMKSGYRDLDTLMYGRPVRVEKGEATQGVTLRLGAGNEQTDVTDLSIRESSLETHGNTISGRLRVEGTPEAPIRVSAHPAELRYRKLGAFLKDPVAAAPVRSDGRFTLEGLPPGRYRLAAWLDVNGNGLPEPDGIDVVVGPQSSPVLQTSRMARK